MITETVNTTGIHNISRLIKIKGGFERCGSTKERILGVAPTRLTAYSPFYRHLCHKQLPLATFSSESYKNIRVGGFRYAEGNRLFDNKPLGICSKALLSPSSIILNICKTRLNVV